jgi:hypothetical protein
LKYSNHSPNTNAHLGRDSLDREAGPTKPHDFIAFENPPRAPNRVTGPSAMLPCCFHAGQGCGVETPPCAGLYYNANRFAIPLEAYSMTSLKPIRHQSKQE